MIELAASSMSPPSAISTTRAEPAKPQLAVQSSPARVMSGEPAPLGLALTAPAEGAVVIITGLVPGMTLSLGGAIGDDAWQASAQDIGDAWIGPPEGLVGSYDIMVELRLADDSIADRQTIRIEWVASVPKMPPISPTPAQHQSISEETAAPTIPSSPAPRRLDREEITAASPAPETHQSDPEESAAPPSLPAPAQHQFERTEIAAATTQPASPSSQPDGTNVAAPAAAAAPAQHQPDQEVIAAQTISPAPAPRELDRAEIAAPSSSPVPAPREADLGEAAAPSSRPAPGPTPVAPPGGGEAAAPSSPPAPAPPEFDRGETAAPPITSATLQHHPRIDQKETTAAAQADLPEPRPRRPDRDEISVLVTRGKSLMVDGDLSAARLVLQRAAEANDVEAALALAGTYDPFVLQKLRVYGVSADAAMARAWYEKAKELGSAEARQRLEILASGAR
jgi:hypothetical protein